MKAMQHVIPVYSYNDLPDAEGQTIIHYVHTDPDHIYTRTLWVSVDGQWIKYAGPDAQSLIDKAIQTAEYTDG